MELSRRVREIKPSPTLTLDAKAKALIEKGEDIVSFGAGEPDFSSPPHAIDYGKNAIDKGKTKYTAVDGIPELKRLAIKKFGDFFGVEYKESECMVSPGAKMAIYEFLFSVVDQGDEVIILSPYWVSYPDMVKMVGGVPKFVETKPENGFKPLPKDIAEAITPKTKCIILNYPCNPTGAVAEPEIFEEISHIVKNKNIWVLSDEIYGTMVYGKKFESFAKFLKERTVVIWGMSKTYSMTGWRIGFAFGPQDVISAMKKVQGQTTSNPTSISQYASIGALEKDDDFVRKTTDEFRKRRDLIYSLLTSTEGIRCVKPEGAFYIFPNVSYFLRNNKTTDELSTFLLEKKKVLVIPGEGFGAPGFIRLSFALSEEKIREGVKRIKDGLVEFASR